ncbi:glycosyltransferase [Demequina sp. B12]|uniref:glycosyltransferase family 2 protein n=1 Tax=Demequina sp. B12 TaxID=2992757 RepID=UPI00237BD32F|nr:glycosyltransferase [Demequina sp. B12]MDE0572028.1 glycosyltransferase [Demequina sp. B12]
MADLDDSGTPGDTAGSDASVRGRGTHRGASRVSSRKSAPRAGRVRRPAATPEDLHVAAALIVAHNRARRIAATVRAARAIPGVDLVLVVDDASTDNTQELARKAGAVVVRHSHYRGRAASIETGASVIAMRDEPGRTPRAILLLPGALGHHAVGAAPLVAAVTEDVADLAVALAEGEPRVDGASSKAARRAVEKATHWTPEEPLAPVRCLTREALEASIPLARGAGLEVGMILDVLHAGLTVTEVECELGHVQRSGIEGGGRARLARYRDVMLAISTRRVKTGLTPGRTSEPAAPGAPASSNAATPADD